MLIIPAIDILNGECVRLTQGDYATRKAYGVNPIEMARAFEAEGAPLIHLVDLDGAKDGVPKNQKLLLQIASSVKIPVEVGGGIRDALTVEAYLKAGVKRVILGTKAVADRAFLERCLKTYGSETVVVGIDARNGEVAAQGWLESTRIDFFDFAKDLKKIGVKHLVFTDIAKDGTLTKPNFEAIERLVRLGFSVVASGGISDVESLRKLRELGAYGAILGKAIYEKKITLAQALEAARPPSGLTKRIIPCLDVKDGRVVKGVNFLNLRDAGDPVELGKRYSDENADELVFLDITASQENRETIFDLVKRVAKEVFIPFTVGGGIKSVDEVRRLLHGGADKVSLNTSAVSNPELIGESARIFGSQCMVVAIDVKRVGDEHKVFVKGGHDETQLEAVDWAKRVESLGAGEILLTSMDRDGTKKGFDLEILRKISEAVNIPVIASGGAGSREDLKAALVEGKADAVLAASLFHYGELTIRQAKEYLKEQGVAIRL